jgi:predicted Na+-dependent transporter
VLLMLRLGAMSAPLQVLQYSVLPLIGFAISRHWGLSSSLAIGVALVSSSSRGGSVDAAAATAAAWQVLSCTSLAVSIIIMP